jgi:uncharacterized protein YjeT (DUF2065 family)
MTQATLFSPVLSPILHDRRLSSIISGAALLQVLLSWLRFPGWPCPFFHALGIPCPGCGMTRATLFLVRGEWKQALTMHAFAPVLIIAMLLIMFCALAPKAQVARLANSAEILERRTGLTALILGGLILYWLARVVIMQAAFGQLIHS